MKGNWKSYFIELVIVIIGITVAFSLNNLAEANKEDDLEKKFIREISDDLIRDSTNLSQSYAYGKVKLEKVEGILKLLVSDREMLYKDSLLSEISIIGNFIFFYPESFTINSLLQSGDFKLLKSDELKKEVLRLIWMYEGIDRDQLNVTRALDDNYYPKVMQEYDLLSGTTNNPEFFYQTQYKNWIAYVYNDTGNLQGTYMKTRKQIRKILGIISENYQ